MIPTFSISLHQADVGFPVVEVGLHTRVGESMQRLL